MKRTDWIIAGFLTVLFLFTLGGVMVFWLQSRAYTNLPAGASAASAVQNESGNGMTAKQAFSAADQLAIQWQPDAQILSASATIVRFETLEDIYNGKADWTVVYYSPIAKAVAEYTVTENSASFLNAKSTDVNVSLLDLETVRLDSNQAMTIAVSNGATDLFEGEADRVALLKLEQSIQTGRPEWRIFIQNETTGRRRPDPAPGGIYRKQPVGRQIGDCFC